MQVIGLFVSFLYCTIIFLVSLWLVRQEKRWNLYAVASFSTGSLTALILLSLLPHSLGGGYPLYLGIIFMTSGFLFNMLSEFWILPRMKMFHHFFSKKKKVNSHSCQHIHYHLLPSSVGSPVMACFILCAFFDGIRLMSSFSITIQTAVLASLSLLFHLLPESVSVIGLGLSSGFSRKNLIKIIVAFYISFFAGAMSFFFFSHIDTFKHVVIPFASGLFLYVCFVHLIPLSIKMKQKKCFVAGIVFCFLLLQISEALFH